jgi:hypothetical protein
MTQKIRRQSSMIVLHPELTLPVETDHYKSVADPAAH